MLPASVWKLNASRRGQRATKIMEDKEMLREIRQYKTYSTEVTVTLKLLKEGALHLMKKGLEE